MVNCSFCGKEIKRLVFCCPSHKVMYHRGQKIPLKKLPVLKTKEDASNFFKNMGAEPSEICKHGMMAGLCKFGCK